jgi:hypothetical protein
MTATTPRVTAGHVLGGIGVVHVALTPAFFPRAVQGIVDAGIVGAVERDPEERDARSAGFWYATAGLGMVALGAALARSERSAGVPPPVAVWAPALLAGWGVTFLPVSGFWTLLAPAALAAWRRARTRS